MNRRNFSLSLCPLLLFAAGCGAPLSPQPPSPDQKPSVEPGRRQLALAAARSGSESEALVARYENLRRAPGKTEPVGQVPSRLVKPFLIEGTWVPSGWMGDGEAPGGALSYRICEDQPQSPPTCEEWSYDPAKGSRDWVAVAYQFPENNWGSVKGKDLSREGFTRITFFARGKKGGERILFKSGGHTRPGAPFPASYEVSSGVVSLSNRWEKFSISLPVESTSMTNTATAFAFAITHGLCPRGCVFYLDDVTFRGPED